MGLSQGEIPVGQRKAVPTREIRKAKTKKPDKEELKTPSHSEKGAGTRNEKKGKKKLRVKKKGETQRVEMVRTPERKHD